METKERFCDICAFQHINELAVEWCSECDEALCSKCKVQHGIAKATRNHTPLSIEDLAQLPSAILSLKQTCDNHDEKVDFYCSNHQQLCCMKCTITSHRDCTSVCSITEVVLDVKTSPGFTDLERSIDDLDQNIEEVCKETHSILASMETEKSACYSKIKDFRLSADKRLDELEQKLLDELEQIYIKQKSKVQGVTDTCLSKTTEISETKQNMTTARKHASDLQAFLLMHKLTHQVQEEENRFQSYLGNQGLMTTTFTFKPSSELSTSCWSSMGSIYVNRKGISSILKRHKDKQAQLLTTPKPRTTENKTVVAKFNISFPPSPHKLCIRDCISLPNNDILLTDRNNNCLLLVSERGIYKDKIKLKSEPFGLAYIDGDKVAVTMLNNAICIVDVKQKSTTSTFDLNRTPNGIQVHKKKDLVVNMYEFGYYIVSLEGIVERKISIGSEKVPYFTLIDDKIYCAKWETSKVLCYDLFGNVQWEFAHDKMKGPNGITCGENGELYVVCFRSNNLFMLDTEGKHGEEVLNKLVTPINVYYDKHTQRLIIGSNGRVTVYSVC